MTLRGRLQVPSVDPRGPDRALIRQRVTLTHEGTTVMTYSGTAYVRRRPTPWPPSRPDAGAR